MLKVVSLDLGIGGGHFFLGNTIWQTLRRLYSGNFHFSLIHCTGIEYPDLDPSFESLHIGLEPELMFENPKKTMLFQYLKHLNPDLLIVETIWFPVAPILKYINATKVFYSFYMPSFWYNSHPWDLNNEYAFDPEEFDLVLSIDPKFSFPGSRQIAPVINVHKSLNHPPSVIRDILQIPEDKKLALIAHNGQEGEIEELMKSSHVDPEEYCQRSLSSYLEESEKLFPLAHYMKGVDLAIGGSGYNFFWETKYYKIPTIYIPQPRIGNEQHWRLEHCRDYEGPYDGADRMVEMILSLF